MKIRAQRQNLFDGVELCFLGDKKGEYIVPTFRVESIDDGFMIPPEARMVFCAPDIQQLFQDLWDSGFRPHEGSGSVAQVRAMEDHISDLRKVAFKSLNIK